MLVAIGRIFPAMTFAGALLLLLTTPDLAKAEPGDCVYNPMLTCCHCNDDPMMGIMCFEDSFPGVAYCSSQVCPDEAPCPWPN